MLMVREMLWLFTPMELSISMTEGIGISFQEQQLMLLPMEIPTLLLELTRESIDITITRKIGPELPLETVKMFLLTMMEKSLRLHINHVVECTPKNEYYTIVSCSINCLKNYF